jgi:hypothetical protein
MNPFVLRKDEEPTTDLACKDCSGKARALWCDNDGNIPLCDPCVYTRQTAYRVKHGDKA